MQDPESTNNSFVFVSIQSVLDKNLTLADFDPTFDDFDKQSLTTKH